MLAAVRRNYDFFNLKITQYLLKKFRPNSLLPKKLNLLIPLVGDILLPC